MEDKNYLKLAQIYNILKNDQIDEYYKQSKKKMYIKSIIENDYDINYKLPKDSLICQKHPDYSGNTASHFIIEFIYCTYIDECFDILIEHGADLYIKNDSGYTPLLLAFMRSIRINNILICYYNMPNFRNVHCKNGISHFHAACRTNRTDIIEYFLKSGVPIDERVNNDSPKFAGYTALHFAIDDIKLGTISLLLNYGASFNGKDANGMTPLHLLIKKLLSQNSAKEDKRRRFLKSAIDKKLFNLPDDAGLTYTHLSCILGDFNILEEKDINTPLNLNSPIYPGYTPLHFAAEFYFSNVIPLLKEGADLLAKDINGITPFDLCVNKLSRQKLIEILLEDKLHQLSQLKFTNDIAVLDAILAMSNIKEFEIFLNQTFETITTIIPSDSPIWPGFSLLHLAVVFNGPVSMILNCSKSNLNILDSNNMSPLHIAYRMKKNNVISTILHFPVSNHSNFIDRYNLSHLHIACYAKNINAIKSLLENGANPNLPISHDCNSIKAGTTPLHVMVNETCEDGSYYCTNMSEIDINCDYVKLLLDYGANPNIPDDKGITSYHIAWNNDCKPILKLMSEYDKNIDREKSGLTRLMIACYIQDLSMVKQELESGADVNKQVSFDSKIWPGDTALHILYKNNKFAKRNEFVELLLSHGADLCLKNASNLTPVHLSKGEIFQILSTFTLDNSFYSANPVNENGISHFHLSCTQEYKTANNSLQAENFLKAGVNVNMPTDFFTDVGYTPLHYAVKNNNVKLTKLLLDYGADPNIKDVNGYTSVHLAIIYFSIDAMRMLMRCPKIDTKATTLLEDTPLEVCIQMFHTRETFMQLLVAKGTCINFQRIINKTKIKNILFHMITQLKPIYFRQLIINEENITIVDDKDQNFIHHLALMKNINFSPTVFNNVLALIDNGCEINRRNNKGKTPLHLAISLKHFDTIRILLGLGADVNIKDYDGKTPYAYITEDYDAEIKLICLKYILKLEIVGLEVDQSNKVNLRNLSLFNFSSNVNIEKARLNLELKTQISRNFSVNYLFNVQFINDYQNISDSKRQVIDNFFTYDNLKNNFPNLCPVIKLQFDKARSKFRRKELLESATVSFQALTGLPVVEMCLEIFSYLDIGSLINVVRADNKKL